MEHETESPNEKEIIILEPSLEEITNNPQKFNIVLFDTEECNTIGTYRFAEPKKSSSQTKYELSVITSYKPNSQVPRRLIKAAAIILQTMSTTQKQKNPSHKIKHNCNFYIMENQTQEKIKKIKEIYKQEYYLFKTRIDATRTY